MQGTSELLSLASTHVARDLSRSTSSDLFSLESSTARRGSDRRLPGKRELSDGEAPLAGKPQGVHECMNACKNAVMSQVTWRAPDELVERVRKAAERLGRSLNDYLTRLAEAAVDPDLADDEAGRLRERLTRAGLIVAPGPARRRPDQKAVALARRRAGEGTQLSDLIKQGRG
jgi:hypothetical protein